MRRVFVLLSTLLLCSGLLTSEAVAVSNSARGPGKAAYDVKLTSDASGRTWTGRERIAFTNTSGKPLAEIYLRLWGNGWDGCKQPVKVSNFSGGVAAKPSVNCTAVKVKLPRALAAGKRTSVAFDVTMTAPDRADRFGRSGVYSFFGNALPVLAVRDGAGWHLEPDVGIGESYYTLAADFVVRLNHPAAVQVPATGRTSTVRRGKQVSTVSIAKQVRLRAAGMARKATRTAAHAHPGAEAPTRRGKRLLAGDGYAWASRSSPGPTALDHSPPFDQAHPLCTPARQPTRRTALSRYPRRSALGGCGGKCPGSGAKSSGVRRKSS
ncbi:hypothetical protein [Kribbella catacumbae]|uniref:hypothetical protein n=1 Tax=Kribbella catacumbae TaxID=460086 RepID=UPI00036F0E4C|nr:hypothetical protein [Kribbella catacumbae]